MIKLIEMEEKVTFYEQMEEKNVGPVILINKFNVNPEDHSRVPNFHVILTQNNTMYFLKLK
jgi:hypothetical protein